MRSITFQRAQVTFGSQNTATVAVQTTAELNSGTQHCQGSVRVLRAPAGWVLDRISINCV